MGDTTTSAMTLTQWFGHHDSPVCTINHPTDYHGPTSYLLRTQCGAEHFFAICDAWHRVSFWDVSGLMDKFGAECVVYPLYVNEVNPALL